MSDILYRWPAGTRYGASVSKEKIYENGAVGAALRDKFIADVQRITWTNKLAEETINLSSTPEVPEIEVIQIDSKHDDVADAVLNAIDRAIPNPIIFEITRESAGRSEVRMAAAHKRRGTAASKLRTYYSTGWIPAATARTAMPTAISLPALYSALITPLTPITAYAGEDVSVTAERLAAVRKLEREISTLERKLRNEPQLNRKVELRRELKDRQAALAALL